MFAAELRTIMINLLSNAIRAAGRNGRISVSGGVQDDLIWVRMENTGRSVTLSTAEKWFRPFESTSVDVESDLGQGMGLGLPITRATLEAYNGDISFVLPRGAFKTAVLFRLPQ
jgi:signal transduction histidine kinase